jgi:hypothetical protein
MFKTGPHEGEMCNLFRILIERSGRYKGVKEMLEYERMNKKETR